MCPFVFTFVLSSSFVFSSWLTDGFENKREKGVRTVIPAPSHAKRLECAQLAAALGWLANTESAGKPDAKRFATSTPHKRFGRSNTIERASVGTPH
jgi:hypothetical protein